MKVVEINSCYKCGKILDPTSSYILIKAAGSEFCFCHSHSSLTTIKGVLPPELQDTIKRVITARKETSARTRKVLRFVTLGLIFFSSLPLGLLFFQHIFFKIFSFLYAGLFIVTTWGLLYKQYLEEQNILVSLKQ